MILTNYNISWGLNVCLPEADSPLSSSRLWPFALAALALACVLNWWLHLGGFYSISWDESGRTLDAYRWYREPFFLRPTTWLPFYRVVVGLALHVYYDLFLTPRVVSFVFGLATLLLTAWLAHELFRNRWVTLLTLLLATFFSQRIALSLAPLSSIMFIAAITASFALLSRWLRGSDARTLILCFAFLALAGTIRYEGWVFAGFFWVGINVLRLRGRIEIRYKDLVLVTLMISAFPLLWLALHSLEHGSPLGFVATVSAQSPPEEVLQRNPLVQFFVTNLACLNLVGLFSVGLLSRKDWRIRFSSTIAGLALLTLSIVMLATGTAQTGPSWRMIAVWAFLLLPFTAHTIWTLGHIVQSRRLATAVRSVAVAMVTGAFLLQLWTIKDRLQWAFPEADLNTGRFLEPMIDRGQNKVLIEFCNYCQLNVKVASQKPQAFVYNRNSRAPMSSGARLAPAYVDARLGVDRVKLQNEGIRYLVFRDPEVVGFLDTAPGLERLAKFGSWSIYSLR